MAASNVPTSARFNFAACSAKAKCAFSSTAGSDDPPFFGTDLTREYRLAHEALGLSLAELWQINLNGLRYGLAETAARRRLMREFEAAGTALGL